MPRFEYPSLRQGLVFAACPSLGASGSLVVDRSGHGNHGTIFNTAGQSPWQPSGGVLGLTFDATNDYADFGTAPACDFGAGNVTISMWARIASFPGAGALNRTLLAKGTGNSGVYNGLVIAAFSFSGINYCQCNFGVSGTQNDTNCAPLAANVWYHLCWQVNSGTRFAYLNGVQTDSRAQSGIVNTSGNNLRIGRDSSISTTYFGGSLDDIRLYSRALTLSEIRLLASRRGIGLTPLPDRAAGLPRKLSVNVGGTWRPADAYVNVGGAWKLAQASTNVAGTWQ